MKLIINRGVPGSGKSTGTRAMVDGLVNPYDYQICSSDSYPGLYDEEGKFHPELLSKSHPACMSDCIDAMQSGVKLVIIDNTNVDAVSIAPYILVAQSQGYEVEIHQYEPAGGITEAFKRNTHKVPLETVIRMADAMKVPLPPYWPKPIVIWT